ncbi:MAG: type II toxin-antitoxin system HipA family toxin [Proteobacteria bacterium]|nr:type II toxin-antitoxin system HipA family toxin [Pseudomonadota bacterium]MBU1738676.1 type II toxin-antitoxin system HipA family toxin [Pseudomonadota bacterium]
MIIKLNIWLSSPSGEILKVGELAVKDPDPRGALHGQFRYAPEYLEAPEAFSLDPRHLPLTTASFAADRPHSGVHGVFEDSLPDDWGRSIMIRRYKLGRSEQRVPHLLRLLGGQGLGALIYGEDEPLPSPAKVFCRHLEELAVMAEQYENDPGLIADDALSMLFQAGSSPGGARPKALVADGNDDYLAKFTSTKDRLDVVSLEAAVMKLARLAGVETAETRVLSFGSRKCLLVKRFDINAAGGRNHLISMQSLLKADGYYYAGYRDLAAAIRYVSTIPHRDLYMLYRQMIFNTMVGNTDDHLKNFCMLHDQEGWRLSPAFDLVPNIGRNQEHALSIGPDCRPPDLETLLAEAKHFGIKRRQQALEVATAVHDAVSGWEAVFKEYGVPGKDAEVIGTDIRNRLEKTGPAKRGARMTSK